jgi:hypothetical protein
MELVDGSVARLKSQKGRNQKLAIVSPSFLRCFFKFMSLGIHKKMN